MTVAQLLVKLENGEEVKTPTNEMLLYILQATINNKYSKFSIDVETGNGQMRLKRRGDFYERI
jgi:hypothetical protein